MSAESQPHEASKEDTGMNERRQTRGQRATAVLSAPLASTSGTTEAASRVDGDGATSSPHDAGLDAQLDAGLAKSAEVADHGNGIPATAQPT